MKEQRKTNYSFLYYQRNEDKPKCLFLNYRRKGGSEVFVPQLSKERIQTKVFVPQSSKERRETNTFVPQLSKGRTKTNLFVLKLSNEGRQTKVFVPQLSKEWRQSEVFVPQLSKERWRSEVFIPQLSKERRRSEVFVTQLSMIWHCYRGGGLKKVVFNYLCTYIYTAPCIMFWMCAYPLRGELGGGWALMFSIFSGSVKWHWADRGVPFGAQKLENSRAQPPPTSLSNGHARIQNIMHGAV